MSDRIRWGILGAANIARKRFIPGVAATSNGVVVALASRDAARAREAADALGIPRAYGTYEELLADAEIDAIYIGLPNSLHAEWTMKCADAGKAVLCEKPLAIDGAQAASVAEYCRERGVLLMEAFMYRFHPRHARVREILAAGEIGELRAVRAAFTFALEPFDSRNVRLQADLAGGALMDVGCYAVNAARMIFAEEPLWASAQGDFRAAFGVEVALAGVLGFSDGRMATFDCGFRGAGQGHYAVVGTRGAIDVPIAFVPPDIATPIVIATAATVREERVPGVDQYALEAEAFADALSRGTPSPLPIADAVGNMRAIDALRESARAGGVRTIVARR